MKKLSIFIDESGDFGAYDKRTEYYIISFVLHEQSKDITLSLNKLNAELKKTMYQKGAIHCEPLIRREEQYSVFSPNERRAILRKLFFFTIKAPIEYKVFTFSKKMYKDGITLITQISRGLNEFLRKHNNFFDKFDAINVYYDNGQQTLSKILSSVFAINFKNFKMKKILPNDYILSQTADMLCTLELINEKIKMKGLSKSEKYIFHSKKDFYKDFYKDIAKKEMK